MRAERQQMLAIPGDDEICLRSHGDSDDLIIIGIVLDHARYLDG